MTSNPMKRKHSPRLGPWLTALLLCGGLSACSPPAERVVVLVSLDTLRADHLGFDGYGRDTSPNLDAFARDDAVTFEAAFAQSNYTLPSHMSIMTGLYPEAHGMLVPETKTADGTRRTRRLSNKIATLAEILAADGFATTAFTDGLLVDGRYGFDRGFDDYRDLNHDESERNGFRKFRDAVHAWISEHSSRDFFLFLHTYDTHSPYVAPEPFRSRFAGTPPGRERPSGSLVHASMFQIHGAMRLHQYPTLQDLIDVYDGGIAYVDHEIGALFARLKREGLWDQALIIITSDHGELFLENNLVIGHGLGSYNEEVHIPLLIKFPGSKFAGRRVDHVVESVDLLPTILTALGLRVPEYVQGQNLLAGIERGEWSKRHAFGVSPNSGYNHYLLKDGYKFIGAVEDPFGDLLRGHFQPRIVDEMLPPPVDGFEPDRGRDYWEQKLYFGWGLDPTGLAEVFHRGDRIYDLRDARFEWQSPELDDPERTADYHAQVDRLVADSVELGRRLGDPAEPGGALGDDDVARLRALGYAGLADGIAVRDAPRAGDSDIATPEIRTRPPLIDRSQLHRGDRHLWEILRRQAYAPDAALPPGFRRRIAAARADYAAFLDQHPDLELWVYWRIAMLDDAAHRIRATGR
ncbi:MAG: sulfatase [Deltaproteobacteria bacterium]|nr:sulfatase [Deltaproteobacteria bacterium]